MNSLIAEGIAFVKVCRRILREQSIRNLYETAGSGPVERCLLGGIAIVINIGSLGALPELSWLDTGSRRDVPSSG